MKNLLPIQNPQGIIQMLLGPTLGETRFFRLQGIKVKVIVKATVSGVLTETAKRAESGQLQFLSEPSEISNLRSCSL